MKQLIVLLGGFLAVFPAIAAGLDAKQIIQRSQLAFYYPGDDMKARVVMQLIDRDGQTRSRDMTMLRRDEAEAGDQKYYMYFHAPGDVRRMTFMVWKDPVKEDQRWIFIPAVDLIRRIAADDKRASFVGSDFTYEDISGRDVSADSYQLMSEDTVLGREVYVIQSIPKQPVEYTRRISWIDKQNFLPLKEEYYDVQDELFRIFTADKVEQVMGWPTIVQRTMKNVKTGHRTEVSFESVSYDQGLKAADFSERRMRRPSRAWIN